MNRSFPPRRSRAIGFDQSIRTREVANADEQDIAARPDGQVRLLPSSLVRFIAQNGYGSASGARGLVLGLNFSTMGQTTLTVVSMSKNGGQRAGCHETRQTR